MASNARSLGNELSVLRADARRARRCASAAQAFTDRNGPRVVSCFCVDCVSSSRSRAAPSFWLRASSRATTPVTCAVASELPDAKS